jgi:hypothetical protein
VAHNYDDTFIQSAKPAHHFIERYTRLQLARRFDAIELVLAAEDLRGFGSAREGACHQGVDCRKDGANAPRRSLHLARALGREWTQGVITAGGSENLSVLGDRVPNDEQLHEREGSDLRLLPG